MNSIGNCRQLEHIRRLFVFFKGNPEENSRNPEISSCMSIHIMCILLWWNFGFVIFRNCKCRGFIVNCFLFLVICCLILSFTLYYCKNIAILAGLVHFARSTCSFFVWLHDYKATHLYRSGIYMWSTYQKSILILNLAIIIIFPGAVEGVVVNSNVCMPLCIVRIHTRFIQSLCSALHSCFGNTIMFLNLLYYGNSLDKYLFFMNYGWCY